MLLILAERDDPVAADLAARADGCGQRWWWLSPLDLVRARITHRLDPSPATTIRSGGHDLQLASVIGVLNRLRWLPAVGFRTTSDREYAAAERHALLISVLAGIAAPIVNPVVPPSLSGPALATAGWLALAAGCGIPVRRLAATSNGRRWPRPGEPMPWEAVLQWPPPTDAVPGAGQVPVGPRPVVWGEPVHDAGSVLVLGEDVFGAPDDRWRGYGAALSQATRCPLLLLHTGLTTQGSRCLVGADPFPAELPPPAAAALLRLVAS